MLTVLREPPLKSKQVLNIPSKKESAGATVKTKGKQTTAKAATKTTATYYTVKKGDKLPAIARKTGVPVKQILALNNIKHKKLKAGQRLVLAKVASPSKPEKDPVADVDNALNEDDDMEEDALPLDNFVELKKENQASEVLGQWGSRDERKLFIKVATGFLGAPYRLGGSTVRGIDCSAFVRKIYQLFDINLPRTAYEQSNVGRSIAKSELQDGVIWFSFVRSGPSAMLAYTSAMVNLFMPLPRTEP